MDFLTTPKMKYALYVTILFVILTLPATYKLVDKIFGKFLSIIDIAEKPTIWGVIVHAIVFFVAFRLMIEYL